MLRPATAASVVLIACALATPAAAQIAVSANDAKVKLVNGAAQVVKDPPADTVSIIDLSSTPPKLLAEMQVPTSVVGPPMSVAVSPDEQIALVTSAMKIDPADATKQAANDQLTVIDLGRSAPTVVSRIKRAVGRETASAVEPKVLTTLQAGKGAAGVSINRQGTLALVANRSEGTVSVFTIAGKTVTGVGKVDLGNDKSGPSHVVFLPDGKSALVTRDNDNKISELKIDGTKVEHTKRDFAAGLRPYGIDVAQQGDVAVVANIGPGTGDHDTISVIDLKAKPARVVNTVPVGQTPEGIKISPDGRYVAVAIMNGSNKSPNSPFFSESGKLIVFSRSGTQLSKSAEAPIGKWCQGIAWASNAKTILVQCMVEEEIQVFSFSGITAKGLKKTGAIKVKGGPAGIRTAEK